VLADLFLVHDGILLGMKTAGRGDGSGHFLLPGSNYAFAR
jgi:hypothetical protein